MGAEGGSLRDGCEAGKMMTKDCRVYVDGASVAPWWKWGEGDKEIWNRALSRDGLELEGCLTVTMVKGLE